MTREPSPDAPTHVKARYHLQESIANALQRAKAVRPGESMEEPAGLMARAFEICGPYLIERKM